MKRFAPLPLTVAVFVLNATAVLASNSPSLTAKVIRLVGSARFDTNGIERLEFHPLRLGDELAPGFLIHTAVKDSTVDLRLGENGAGAVGTLRIFSNSVVSVVSLAAPGIDAAGVTKMEFALRAGRILASLGSGSEVGIRLIRNEAPGHLISLRMGGPEETVFVADLSGGLIVLKGSLAVNPGASEKLVSAGEQLRGEGGEVIKLPLDAAARSLWP